MSTDNIRTLKMYRELETPCGSLLIFCRQEWPASLFQSLLHYTQAFPLYSHTVMIIV